MSVFPKITFIYDRYKKASSKRKAVVELRVTYNRKQKYISTGIELYPKEWKKGIVINNPNAQLLNQQLDKLLMDVRQILMDMSKDSNIDIFDIPNKLEKLKKGSLNLFDFIKQRAEVKEYGKAKDTIYRYENFIKVFKQWGGIKDYEDITEENIISFDKYLSTREINTYSRWQNYHRFLNSFTIDAMDAGYVKRNPYKWMSIDKGRDKDGKALQRCLTYEEFERIKTIKLSIMPLERVRDVFIFQTYTCLSYADLKAFDIKKILTINDMKVYSSKRKKTGEKFTIPLLPEALAILKKYNNKLPIISNVKYNQHLKTIAKAAGIDKPVSTHYARHTGATLLLNEGVDIRIISKICGHSSTKMTEQVYAKLLDETVVDAIKKLKK